MSPRSNGVMKVRRTAMSTSRVTLSASCSRLHHRLAVAVDGFAALEHAAQRLGAGGNDGGMLGEEIEEFAPRAAIGRETNAS